MTFKILTATSLVALLIGGTTVCASSSYMEEIAGATTSARIGIKGHGAFVMARSAYTTDGKFSVDRHGRLKNDAGFLQGYRVDEKGIVVSKSLVPETINVRAVPTYWSPTTSISLSLNLPSTDTVQKRFLFMEAI